MTLTIKQPNCILTLKAVEKGTDMNAIYLQPETIPSQNATINKSLTHNHLHRCVQGKGVDNVQNLNLKHNEPDAGIRRPNGLTDKEWDYLVFYSTVAVESSETKTSFMLEMVKILLTLNKKPFSSILKSLGIDTKKDIIMQNWEHTAFRFFRHFCPEDYRNAMNHSGLKFATLEFKDNRFVWVSTMEVQVCKESEIFDLVGAKVGDKVSIVAEGLSDVDTVTLTSGSNMFQYYEKGRSKAFGDTMYMLKQAVIQNKKEALRNSIQKPNV